MPETLRLGDHCVKIGSGATPRGGKEVYLFDGPFSLIRSQNVYNHGFEFDGLAFINEEQAEKLSNVTVKLGDVLINITGDSVARACQVHPDALPARVNQHVAILRPRPHEINPAFLRYWLVTPTMQARLLGLASAGATRPALTKSMLENLRLPALPVDTQERIVEILGSLDDKIELNRRMNETLEAMAQAIFRDWFVDFGPTRRKMEGATDPVEIMGGLVTDAERAQSPADLFPSSLGDAGLPVGWEFGNFGELADVQSGKRPPTKVENSDDQHPYPVWGGNGVSWYCDSYLFSSPFIITGRVGTLGTVYRVEGKVWASDNALCIFPKAEIAFDYSYYSMLSFPYEALNSGSTQPLLTQSVLKQQQIVLPPAKVLRSFSESVGPLMTKIRANQTASKTLATTRDLLLPKLMSGKIRLGEAEEMVEAAQ